MGKTTYRYDRKFWATNVYFVRAKYPYYSKGLAVVVFLQASNWDSGIVGDKLWEDWGTITVNLMTNLGERQAFIDENKMPGIGELLENNGLAKPTGIMQQRGDCVYPLYEFTDKFYEESCTK